MRAKKTLFKLSQDHTPDPINEAIAIDVAGVLSGVHPALYGWSALQDLILSGPNYTTAKYSFYKKRTRADMYKCK